MDRRLVALTVAGLTVAVVGLAIALIVVAGDDGSDSTTSSEAAQVLAMASSAEARPEPARVLGWL